LRGKNGLSHEGVLSDDGDDASDEEEEHSDIDGDNIF